MVGFDRDPGTSGPVCRKVYPYEDVLLRASPYHPLNKGGPINIPGLHAFYNPVLLFQDGHSLSPGFDGSVEPSPTLLG